MSKKNKARIYNRLFFKMYLNYAVMLLVTAVLICLIFMNLYEKNTMNNIEAQMKVQAGNISTKMAEFITYEKYDEYFNYQRDLEELHGLDVWTISNPGANNPMAVDMETNSFEELSDQGQYKWLVESAFRGKLKSTTIEHDEIYDEPMIIMSAPVYGNNREVVGAILLFTEVKGQRKIVSESLQRVIASSIGALAISFAIVILFTTHLSAPITKMRGTALELAAGNYKAKTGINRNDEIGDLAKTVDILSEKLLENEIQRKNLDQMRLDFFANVSHELRTPITVVRAYTETLVDGVVTDKEKINQYYDKMLLECKSMERLVGDLLLLSKMQNPDFFIEKEPVNLVQVFEDIIRSANAIGEKKHINIEISKESIVYMILGDYDRLRQMFMVILDNAVKFSEENKTVHIKLSKQDKIKVSIRDEGIGINPEDISNIFEKFYKSSLRQNASGSGLGLAIAKQIALKHDGSIEVFSKPGEGSEFVFTFPEYEVNY